MKKILFILLLAGLAGLTLYYIRPEILKRIGDKINAIQLPLPDFAGDMPSAGSAPAKAKEQSSVPVKCAHCRDGKVKCAACKGTGISSRILCYNCGREAVVMIDSLTQDSLVYCPKCDIKLGRRADLKCRYCRGDGVVNCSYCGGTGLIARVIPVNTVTCTVCGRTGTVPCPKTVKMKRQFISPANNTGKGACVREGSPDDLISVACPECGGSGRKKCPECGGKCYIVLKAE